MYVYICLYMYVYIIYIASAFSLSIQLFESLILFLLDTHPVLDCCSSHWNFRFNIWGHSRVFYRFSTKPFAFPSVVKKNFLFFFHAFTSTRYSYCFFITAIITHVRWCLTMILIYTSLTISDAEDSCAYQLALLVPVLEVSIQSLETLFNSSF